MTSSTQSKDELPEPARLTIPKISSDASSCVYSTLRFPTLSLAGRFRVG
jgi:hypothetical protein